MGELFGAVQRGLGAVLSGVYEVVPSYAIAIIMLTIATRVALLPLALKQMRSTRAMQKLQPEMKDIQKKYKELQKKVRDRKELQDLRLQQNQEVMALYRKHGANPAGCAGSLVAQMPVFIALFTIFRASVLMVAGSAQMVSPSGALVAPDPTLYTPEQARATICRPIEETTGGLEIECFTQTDDASEVTTSRFVVDDLVETDSSLSPLDTGGANVSWVATCSPIPPLIAGTEEIDLQGDLKFGCQSATGTGHLPRDGDLFADVNADRATILGMHPGCTPTQSRTDTGLRRCSAGETDTGLLAVAPYFLLVLLIAGTQYVAGKQMTKTAPSAGGQAAQQQAMMMKIMPIFFGFISLNFQAGLNFYYFIFNLWQMGQQRVIFQRLEAQEKNGKAAAGRKKGVFERAREQLQPPRGDAVEADDVPTPSATPTPSTPPPPSTPPTPPTKAHPRSKKKKRRRKR